MSTDDKSAVWFLACMFTLGAVMFGLMFCTGCTPAGPRVVELDLSEVASPTSEPAGPIDTIRGASELIGWLVEIKRQAERDGKITVEVPLPSVAAAAASSPRESVSVAHGEVIHVPPLVHSEHIAELYSRVDCEGGACLLADPPRVETVPATRVVRRRLPLFRRWRR